MSTPAHMSRTTLFTSKAVPFRNSPSHSTSSLMGGKWRPRIEVIVPFLHLWGPQLWKRASA